MLVSSQAYTPRAMETGSSTVPVGLGHHVLKNAFGKVAQADKEMDAVQKRLRDTELAAKKRAYLEAQAAYKAKREEEKQEAAEQRKQYAAVVEENARQRDEAAKQKQLALHLSLIHI